VRRGRIKTIEADLRKHEKSRAEYAERFAAWQKVPTLEGADKPIIEGDRGICDPTPAGRLAYALANAGSCWGDYKHPRQPELTAHSIYALLTHRADPLTPAEAAAIWLEGRSDPTNSESRWSKHYELRLAYERAMIAAEGGTAADVEMEPGGFVGNRQIQKVNKSATTGKVVSVQVWGSHRGYTKESDYTQQETRPCLVTLNIERSGESVYRAPTDAERVAFVEQKKQAKAKAKANNSGAPSLINPTDADAERLQGVWNARSKAAHIKHGRYGEAPQSEVLRLTQAQYSANSKGSNARLEAIEIGENGIRLRHRNYGDEVSQSSVACKVRVGGGAGFYSPNRVIVITDKPQKPLQIDWAQAMDAISPQPNAAVVV
jgi:hypothetical protein